MSFRRAIKSPLPLLCVPVPRVFVSRFRPFERCRNVRREKEVAGSVPLHTIRANIDYAQLFPPSTRPVSSASRFGSTKGRINNVTP
jgi:hypothetical protein